MAALRRLAAALLLVWLGQLLLVALRYADELRRVPAVRVSGGVVDRDGDRFAHDLARAAQLSAPVRLRSADGTVEAFLLRPGAGWRALRLIAGAAARNETVARRLAAPGGGDPLQRLLGVRVA